MTKIRKLRKEKGFTQNQMASLLGISQTSYANYEQGTRMLSAAMLVRLAELYETSTDYLLDLTDDPKPYPRAETDQK